MKTLLRLLFAGSIAAYGLWTASPAYATPADAIVVTACGAQAYSAGANRQVSQTTGGVLCAGGAASSTGGATHAQTAALASNLAAKASAGTLYSFEVSADATLSGAAWYVMIFDATALPSNGAITPAKCYSQASGTTQMGGTFAAPGVAFATGIVIGVSTTGCFTQTASVHAFIAADYQ